METHPTLRFLRVVFDLPLAKSNVPAFRAAIIEKVGRVYDRFHNHQVDGRSIYRYPLIQYKTFRGKAGIICLHEAIEDIHQLFEHRSWEITFLGVTHLLQVEKLDLKEFGLRFLDTPQHYQIYDWIALNQKNYQDYQSHDSLADRYALLEKTLTSHILGFARDVNWQVTDPIQIAITEPPEMYAMFYKNTRMKAFRVQFTSNVLLPHFIGLGKGAGRGFGIVMGGKRRSSPTKKVLVKKKKV